MKVIAEKSSPQKKDALTADSLSNITEKHEAVIAALLSHPSIKQAAAAAGVSETTVWRYMQDAAFMEQYRHARRRVVEHAVVKLQQDAAAAAAVLLEIALDTKASAGARVSASRVILDRSMRSLEMDDLEARVERMEAHLEEKSREAPPADDEEEDDD